MVYPIDTTNKIIFKAISTCVNDIAKLLTLSKYIFKSVIQLFIIC